MKILHLTNTLMAGSPSHLSGIINKYTEHSSKCIARRKFTGSKQRNLFWNYDLIGPSHKDLYDLIDWCDIVHFHGKKYPADIKNKPSLLQYHSEPRGYKVGSTDAEFRDRKLVIAQYHPRFFGNDCTIVPNLIDIWGDIYTKELNNKPQDVIRIFFSWASHVKGTWSDKAVESVVNILNRIKSERGDIVEIFALTNVSYDKCMAEKSKSHIVIGDCKTGSYHLSSLEGCAVGAVTFNNSDNLTLKYMREVSGTPSIPFVLSDVNSLYTKINYYLDHRAELMAEQIRARNWMERFWDPKKQVKRFIDKYSEIIEGYKMGRYNNPPVRKSTLIHRGKGSRSVTKIRRRTGSAPMRNKLCDKYVLIGSALYVKDYWPKVRDFYKQNGFKVVAINNAWSVVKNEIDEWFIPDDFMKGAGTVIPSPEEYKKLPVSPMPPGRVPGYLSTNTGKSTMALNVMHILHNRAKSLGHDLVLSVIGSDFIYETGKNSHFYGNGSDLPHVQRMLKQNNPKYVGISADPLRFGDEWLISELNNIKSRYDSSGFTVCVDSPLDKTRLPFTSISSKYKENKELPYVFVSVDNNIANEIVPLYNSIIANSGFINFNILYDKSVSSKTVISYVEKGWNSYEVDVPQITFNKGRISKPMYYRWLIPSLIDVDKAIYLDVDVIVLGDLKELWSLDLGDNYVAAVRSHYRDNVFEEWDRHCLYKVPPEERFKQVPLFFSGQLVLNCKKWREDNLFDTLVSIANQYKLYDMLALNIAVKDSFVELDKEWCFPGFNNYVEGRAVGNMADMMENPVFKDLKLIHWYGPKKPWLYNIIGASGIKNLNKYLEYMELH